MKNAVAYVGYLYSETERLGAVACEIDVHGFTVARYVRVVERCTSEECALQGIADALCLAYNAGADALTVYAPADMVAMYAERKVAELSDLAQEVMRLFVHVEFAKSPPPGSIRKALNEALAEWVMCK